MNEKYLMPIAMRVVLVGLFLASACLYDTEDRCGDDQKYDAESGLCMCIDGYGFETEGNACAPCSENERSAASRCVCAEGFLQNASTGECEAAAAGFGAQCDLEISDSCPDSEASHCALDSGGAGYCTRAECADGDCPGAYACDTSSTPSFCARPPTGLGTSCMNQDDCAAFEASFCETYQSNQCMVAGCTLEPDDCFSGYECLDLSGYGMDNLCAPIGSGS